MAEIRIRETNKNKKQLKRVLSIEEETFNYLKQKGIHHNPSELRLKALAIGLEIIGGKNKMDLEIGEEVNKKINYIILMMDWLMKGQKAIVNVQLSAIGKKYAISPNSEGQYVELIKAILKNPEDAPWALGHENSKEREQQMKEIFDKEK